MLLAVPLLVIVVEIISAAAGDPEVKKRFSALGGIAREDEAKTVYSIQALREEYEGRGQESNSSDLQHQTAGLDPSPSASAASYTHWRTCNHQHKIRIGWAFLLLMLQAWYASISSLLWYSISPDRPTAALRSYFPWLFITLPSAMYFMVILAIEARGSKAVNISGFITATVYSVALWPVCLSKLGGGPKRPASVQSLVDDPWPSPIVYVVASAVFFLLYVACVCAIALYRRGLG